MNTVSAVCHVHSTWSYDGSWELVELANVFSEKGADVVLMTEHDRGYSDERLADYRVACEQASTNSIVLVPGIEYSDSDNRVHILVWGPVPFLGEGRSTIDVLRAVTRYGGTAVFAHPRRREAWRAFIPDWERHLTGVEVWNRKYDGWAPAAVGRELCQQSVPFVGLDFHTPNQMFPLRMQLTIDGAVNEDSVVACLHQRQCAPFAFGRAVNNPAFDLQIALLTLAERGRSAAARAKRYSLSLVTTGK